MLQRGRPAWVGFGRNGSRWPARGPQPRHPTGGVPELGGTLGTLTPHLFGAKIAQTMGGGSRGRASFPGRLAAEPSSTTEPESAPGGTGAAAGAPAGPQRGGAGHKAPPSARPVPPRPAPALRLPEPATSPWPRRARSPPAARMGGGGARGDAAERQRAGGRRRAG